MLIEAIRDGLRLLTWSQESFAYADSFDQAAGRYPGLRCGELVNLSETNMSGILVRSDVAQRQQEADRRPVPDPSVVTPGGTETPGGGTIIGLALPPGAKSAPKRFHGSVTLDPGRVGRDAGRIADEVVSHLKGLVGSTVKVTLEIEAEVPSGVPDNVVRIVTENSRTLKFESQGFETE